MIKAKGEHRRHRRALCLALLFAGHLGFIPDAWAASRAQTLYNEALIKETGERDPEAAVPLYRRAIESAGPDHRLISKARLHLGACLERIGKLKDAESVYLQIVKESTTSLIEAVQAAQANIERLQAQEKRAREQSREIQCNHLHP